MDFLSTDGLAEYRPQAQEWTAAHLREEWLAAEHETGTHHNPVLHQLLATEGILGAGWPKEYGGSDVPPGLADAILEEIQLYGLRMDGWITTWMALHTIEAAGTEELKREIIPAGLAGEAIIVLGYTEPSCGSDVAAAKTRAVRDGDHWVINGSKMFTSTAHMATHVFLLTRTNTEVPKHRGLSMFVVPLEAPGIEIQPIYTLGGQRTNTTFYNDVAVPDTARVGEVDGGWSVMRVALTFERSINENGFGPTLARRLTDWYAAGDPERRARGQAPAVRAFLARAAIDDEVSHVMALRVESILAQGGLPGVESSMLKLFRTETLQRQHGGLLDLLGADAVLETGDGPLAGEVEYAFRNSVLGSIAGGTSEVQREIVAERRLGLPRARSNG
jgi:alkylation response protein AidB-like acyl-CoA dehydrogenase